MLLHARSTVTCPVRQYPANGWVGIVMNVMHRFCMRACAVATAGVALGTWGVTAASASGGASATIHHGALRFANNDHAFGLSTAGVTSTRTFAGYQTTVPAGSATVMTGSFAVPTLSCTTAQRFIAPSAGVLVNNFRSASVSFVFVGCANGAA